MGLMVRNDHSTPDVSSRPRFYASSPSPGLANLMTPRPDHGELSYRGSGRLSGRKALITGWDSGVGQAAAFAFAPERAEVAAAYVTRAYDESSYPTGQVYGVEGGRGNA